MKSLSEHMSAPGRVNHSFCKGTGSFKRGNGVGEDGIGEQHHLSLLYCLHVNTPWSRFQEYSASKFNLHRHAEEFKQARTKKRKSTSFKSKKHLIRIPHSPTLFLTGIYASLKSLFTKQKHKNVSWNTAEFIPEFLRTSFWKQSLLFLWFGRRFLKLLPHKVSPWSLSLVIHLTLNPCTKHIPSATSWTKKTLREWGTQGNMKKLSLLRKNYYSEVYTPFWKT